MNLLSAKHASGQGEGHSLIYVVDDEPMLLELTTAILSPLGYQLKTFRDAETALRSFSLEQPRPALVITDYTMKPMNGLELMDACRRVEPGQKVLMVSGTVEEEFFDSTPIQPDQFLAKPYRAKQLVEVVRTLAGG